MQVVNPETNTVEFKTVKVTRKKEKKKANENEAEGDGEEDMIKSAEENEKITEKNIGEAVNRTNSQLVKFLFFLVIKKN